MFEGISKFCQFVLGKVISDIGRLSDGRGRRERRS